MKIRFVVFVAGLSFGGPLLACTCMAGRTVGDYYDRATYVFTAVVTGTKRPRVPEILRDDPWLDRSDPTSVNRILQGSFRLTSTYKGDPERLDAVYTHLQSATCGVTLIRGEEYLFFADDRGVINLCGGNIARDSTAYFEVLSSLRRYFVDAARPVERPVIPLVPDG